MYEPNLTSEELRSYYTVLKNSENTANEEEHSRKLHESMKFESSDVIEDSDENETEKEIVQPQRGKKQFTPKTWSTFKQDTHLEFEENTGDIDAIIERLDEDNKKPRDATKTTFGFNEMLDSLEKTTFHIVKRDLQFIPIQCTPKFLKADLKTKVKILYAYHSKTHTIKEQLARQSFFPALTPKPIITIEQFPSSLSENCDLSQTYVCRSGRQTKRKVYYDENSLDDDFESTTNNKKPKNTEEEWVEKGANKKSDTKGKSVKAVNNNNEVLEADKNVMEDVFDLAEKSNNNINNETSKKAGNCIYN